MILFRRVNQPQLPDAVLPLGPNAMDYDGGTNRTLAGAFQREAQNQLILKGLRWLGLRR